mmetsp:Transcript_106985/g.189183  ORF Transcript_106985/g.189183 Transcript_106985/m.189183 type:complete len:88 (-) Transcript_106985:38-301(-)
MPKYQCGNINSIGLVLFQNARHPKKIPRTQGTIIMLPHMEFQAKKNPASIIFTNPNSPDAPHITLSMIVFSSSTPDITQLLMDLIED